MYKQQLAPNLKINSAEDIYAYDVELMYAPTMKSCGR